MRGVELSEAKLETAVALRAKGATHRLICAAIACTEGTLTTWLSRGRALLEADPESDLKAAAFARRFDAAGGDALKVCMEVWHEAVAEKRDARAAERLATAIVNGLGNQNVHVTGEIEHHHHDADAAWADQRLEQLSRHTGLTPEQLRAEH